MYSQAGGTGYSAVFRSSVLIALLCTVPISHGLVSKQQLLSTETSLRVGKMTDGV